MLLQERDERLEEEEKEGGGISEGGTYVACCAGKQAVIAKRAAREARWDWSLGDVGQPAAGVDRLDRGEGRELMPAMQEGEEEDVLARKGLADAGRTRRPDRRLRSPGGRGLKVRDGHL